MYNKKLKRQNSLRTIQGNVFSAKMDKTITVLIQQKVKHPIYKKYICHSTKFYAHDENNECKVGDRVRIQVSRPLSKYKNWRLLDIINKAV